MKRLFRVWFGVVVTCLFFVCLEGEVAAQATSGAECDVADVNGSGYVGSNDIITLIQNWHVYSDVFPQGDLNGDGWVNTPDIIIVIGCHGHYVNAAACNDNIDNDGDGAIDFPEDPGCSSPSDTNETDPQPGQLLTPGDGFTQDYEEPGPSTNGLPGCSGEGCDAKAIARWDVVPYQTITEDFQLGIVAFHMNGIHSVVFSADNGPEVVVTEMTLNERTNVHEYQVTLDVSAYDTDRLSQIRAIVYPNRGVPRVLQGPILQGQNSCGVNPEGCLVFHPFTVLTGNHAMFLSVNAQATLPTGVRYVSINAGNNNDDGLSPGTAMQHISTAAASLQNAGQVAGGTIYLLNGMHPFSSDIAGTPYIPYINMNRWLTITPATGNDNVTVTAGRLKNERARLKDVAVQLGAGAFHGYVSSDAPDHANSIWLDGCNITGNGAGPDGGEVFNFVNLPGGTYVTDSTLTSSRDGIEGSAIIRNTSISNVTEDPLNGFLVVNVEFDHSQTPVGWPPDHPPHPDMIDIAKVRTGDSRVENAIYYNLRVTDLVSSQGIYLDGKRHEPYAVNNVDDFAMVNILMEHTGGGAITSQLRDSTVNHMLIWNVTHLNRVFRFLEAGEPAEQTIINNLSVKNSVFEYMTSNIGAALNSAGFDNNHSLSCDPGHLSNFGTNMSCGSSQAALFVNPLDNPSNAGGVQSQSPRNYHPSVGSILYNRPNGIDQALPLTSGDAFSDERGNPTAIGAFRSLEE